MRKIAVSIASGKEKLEKVSYDMIPKFLGKPKTFSDERLANPEIGTSTGLAWTPVGGSILFIETVLFPGKGDIKLTGNLGKIIQESANIMHTWIKANAENLNIDKEKINKFDIHVHFPENSVGKEGASAGSAICCSMVTAYSKKLINPEIAMTGEMTLRGRILPVGGIREKVMAAFRAGIKHVILPEKNIRDVEEIPKEVKDLMKFTLVSNINEVLDIIFLDNVKDMGDNNIMNISKKSELINIGA
jgi:ATP-dependent Lon protease